MSKDLIANLIQDLKKMDDDYVDIQHRGYTAGSAHIATSEYRRIKGLTMARVCEFFDTEYPDICKHCDGAKVNWDEMDSTDTWVQVCEHCTCGDR